MVKWFTAILGFTFFRFPGAILGYFIGSFLENLTGSGKSGGGSIFGDLARPSVSPADFELNLLSLCSVVIKADGTVSQRELDYVRQYFVATYGKERANAIFRTFNEVIKKREISPQKICDYLNQRTRYEVRVQLLHFLFGIAQADGQVTTSEVDKLRQLSGYLKVGNHDFESIKAMFFKDADQAYKILKIEPSASNEEIKKAYRTLAKQYHPDRVVTQDEAIKKGAEEKFKEVQKAYETLQKERSLS